MVVRCHALVLVVGVMLMMKIGMRLLMMGVVVLHHRRRGGLVPEVALIPRKLFEVVASIPFRSF